jgi:hypothetical protein
MPSLMSSYVDCAKWQMNEPYCWMKTYRHTHPSENLAFLAFPLQGASRPTLNSSGKLLNNLGRCGDGAVICVSFQP